MYFEVLLYSLYGTCAIASVAKIALSFFYTNLFLCKLRFYKPLAKANSVFGWLYAHLPLFWGKTSCGTALPNVENCVSHLSLLSTFATVDSSKIRCSSTIPTLKSKFLAWYCSLLSLSLRRNFHFIQNACY